MSDPVRSILIRFPNWVGDVVMAEPVIRILKGNYPEARIVVAVRQYAAKILAGHPGIDRLIPCHDKGLSGMQQLASAIRDESPDLAILLPNSFRSFLSVRWGGVKNIVGYRRGFRKFFIQGPTAPMENGRYQPVPMTDYYLALLSWMGLKIDGPVTPHLYLTDEESQRGDELLKNYGIAVQDHVVALNPGAQFGSSKCWPPKYFAALAEQIQNQFKSKLLLLVGPGEDGIADEIVQASQAEIINTGPDKVDLGVLKALARRMDLLVTNDTGPRHYAVAFGKPVVVLMGPTDPRHTNCHLDKTTILREDLPCVPCHKKVCPIDHPCMIDMTPDKVFHAVQQIMDQGGAGERSSGADTRSQTA
jgi:heptosyltransferase-2